MITEGVTEITVKQKLRNASALAAKLPVVIKPHSILLLSASLALCAAVFLNLAHHEPKAALAAGYALLAGITSLALYLSSRQTARASGAKEVDVQTPQIPEARETKSLTLDERTAQRQSVANVSKPLSQEASRYKPGYTSHSRA